MQYGKCRFSSSCSILLYLNTEYLVTRLSFVLLFVFSSSEYSILLSRSLFKLHERSIFSAMHLRNRGIKERLTIVRLDEENFLSLFYSRWSVHCFASPCFNLHPRSVLALYALFYHLSITSAFTFVLDATRFEDRFCLSLSIQTIGIDWTIVDLNITFRVKFTVSCI